MTVTSRVEDFGSYIGATAILVVGAIVPVYLLGLGVIFANPFGPTQFGILGYVATTFVIAPLCFLLGVGAIALLAHVVVWVEPEDGVYQTIFEGGWDRIKRVVG